jgi:hypothetical protein
MPDVILIPLERFDAAHGLLREVHASTFLRFERPLAS